MNWSAQTDGNWVYVEPGWVEQLQAAPVYADAEVQQAFMEIVARIDRLPADEEAFARFLYLPSQLLAPALLDLYAYPSKGDEAQALTQLITVGRTSRGQFRLRSTNWLAVRWFTARWGLFLMATTSVTTLCV